MNRMNRIVLASSRRNRYLCKNIQPKSKKSKRKEKYYPKKEKEIQKIYSNNKQKKKTSEKDTKNYLLFVPL